MGWLLFMHYISIFAYGLRSMVQNEFLSPKYDTNVGGGQTLGQAILGTFEVKTDPAWLWGGIGFLAGFFFLTNAISGVAIDRIRIQRNVGTARIVPTDDTAAAATSSSSHAIVHVADIKSESHFSVSIPSPMGSPAPLVKQASAQSALPFTPMSIAWRNIRYTVTIPAATAKTEGRASRDKVLLQSVSGLAAPGQLTALMGASGAGVSIF